MAGAGSASAPGPAFSRRELGNTCSARWGLQVATTAQSDPKP